MDQGFQEYRLFSAGRGPATVPHHIMKVPSQKFDLDSMQQPVRMTRQQKEEVKEEESTSNYFKKKTKAIFLGKEEEDVVMGENKSVHRGALIASIGSRHADPDKAPWEITDGEQTFIGNLEGSQNSNYVIFVSTNEGFKVVPVAKWYRFNPKLTHKTLTIEEAEAIMNTRQKKDNRWLMKEGELEKTKPKKKGEKVEKEKSVLQKIRDGDPLDEVPVKKEPRSRKRNENIEDNGFDYDENEQFADDEEINFGIDDEEERKEAQKRLHTTKIVDEIDEEDDLWKSKDAKKLAKSLVKREKSDFYEDMGQDNPYWSDMEDDEEEEEKAKPTNPLLEKAKKNKLQKTSRNSSPAIKEPIKIKLTAPSTEPPAKRIKLEDGTTPPPPTAAQVIKRMEKEQRNRLTSASPPPATPTPSAEQDPNIMTADDIIRIVKSKPDGIGIRDLVRELKSWFDKDKDGNQKKLKELMSKYMDHDKATKIVTLKKEYHDWIDPQVK
ncbi:hypothetical protein HK103_005374 [Boothiomyces macroporosus]|uniref:Transcription initiation factor IIF subunit alpha n=1 Tax=Boothiomyces macroporosus TaxID=261099 RepID=A0AAD5YAW1_9FUNG|nr:hypothetical protein HK103_005374 [Boothiomyces macroporosus]